MFKATVTGHYIPVTWVTLGLDYLLWGMNPAGYHLTNIVLHALNAVCFTLVAVRLLRLARPRSAETTLWAGAVAAALFFALHPLRAESVAWVTERRGLLSAFFALLTVLTYLRMCAASGAARPRWLVVSVGCYALALGSKAAVMTLPLVLVVLDAYPLGRLGPDWRRWTARDTRAVWLEKIPYALLALVAGVIAMAVIRANEVFFSMESYPPAARVAMLAYGLVFYVARTAIPVGLSPLYELPQRVSALDPPFLASVVAVALVTGSLCVARRSWPAGLASSAAYALVLLPVSGLSQTGHQLVADRYSYLSCLPWAVLLGAGVCAALDAVRAGRVRAAFARAAGGGLVLWLAGLTVLTWFQVQFWRDSATLWRSALDVDPACVVCHNQLGAVLGNRGDPAAAAPHFERALALRPDDRGLHVNLGLALLNTARPAQAVPHFVRALEQRPDDVETRVYLGTALGRAGRVDEAIEQLRRAVRQNQAHPRARYELARAYFARGDRAAAAEQVEALRRLDPRLADQLK